MKPKHSPEPWALNPYDGGAPEIYGFSHRGQTRAIARVLYHNGSEDPEVRANAHRIVACVNALAGIEDPAAAIAAAREALEACRDHIAGMTPIPMIPLVGKSIKVPKAWDKAHHALALLSPEVEE